MCVRRHILSALLILVGIRVALAEPSLDVTVNRDRIYVGESFLLEVKVGGSGQPGAPDLSALKDCRIDPLGSQNVSHQSITIVNGQVRREGFVGRTYSYKITPARAGEQQVGPITAVIEGVTLSRPGPTVTVTGITQQDLVSISVVPSREAVLVDEPFDIRLVVRIHCLPGAYATVDPILPSEPPNLNVPFLGLGDTDGLKGPDIKALLNSRLLGGNQAGFSINDYTVQNDLFDSFFNRASTAARFRFDRRDVDEHGKRFFEYTLTLSYTAQSEGAHTFGPVVFKGNVPTAVNGRGQAHSTEIFAVGPAAIVRVVPPPEENRPDSYIGAIGSNLTVLATLDAQTCNVGDPLKLTLTLSGAIQLENIFPPKLGLQTNLVTHFEVYDDTVLTLKQSDRRAYAYTLRPRHAGAFELPPIAVSYYDVTDRQYRTVNTVPVPLKVRQSAEVTASQVIGGTTNAPAPARQVEAALMQPAGIRIEQAGLESGRLTGNRLAAGSVAAAGPFVFLVSSLVLLYRRKRIAFARFCTRRRALTNARHLLRGTSLSPAAKATLPEEPLRAEGSAAGTLVCRAMRQYLSERLGAPADSATPDEAMALLLKQGLEPDLARRFRDVMQVSFNATFSAAAGTPRDLASVHEVLADVDKALAANPRASRPAGGAGRAMTILLLLGLPLVVRGSTLAEREFIWSEALSQMSSAQAPHDYLAAAATYQKLVDCGARNATVFYNQGTALLLAGKYPEAIQVLHRAERYGGSAPDLRRNLAIARGRLEGLKNPVTSWQQMALFWHYGLSCATRTLIVAVAFALLWIAGALRLLGSRNTARSLSAVALLVFLLFGASVLTSLQQEGQAARPAVLQGLD